MAKSHLWWLGALLIVVGFSDNIYSWLTPNTKQGALLDAVLILVGAYFLFARSRERKGTVGLPRLRKRRGTSNEKWVGWILILLAFAADFGFYIIFPLGAGIWTAIAVAGSYLVFSRHGRK